MKRFLVCFWDREGELRPILQTDSEDLAKELLERCELPSAFLLERVEFPDLSFEVPQPNKDEIQ